MHNDREFRDKYHEIDLLGMFELLWRRRFIVLSVASTVAMFFVIYVILRAPLYEARAIVKAPAQEDISQLNYGRGGHSGLKLLTTTDVYDIYVHSLLSESLRRNFFENIYLPQLPDVQRDGAVEDLYSGFSQLLQVVQLSKEPLNRYSVSVKLPDPVQAALWVKQYIEMAEIGAKAEVLENVRSDAFTKVENLRREIVSGRETARKQREDREVRLGEAFAVAKSIGLDKPQFFSGVVISELSSGGVGALSYMRGSDALAAEIESLKARVSDDPFIDGLRELQVELDFYSGLKILPSTIAVYRLDGTIGVPDRSILPNGALVVVMGVAFGLVTGVLLVLMWYVIRITFIRAGNVSSAEPNRHDRSGGSGQAL